MINILLELMTGTSDLLPIRRNITVREAYFDAPVLDQLMMDVIANVSALCHWTKRAAPEAPECGTGFIGGLTAKIDSKSVQ